MGAISAYVKVCYFKKVGLGGKMKFEFLVLKIQIITNSRQKMVIFLGNTNSGDQNFLNPFIYHRDTSYYMVLKKIGVTPSGKFASILTNTPVNQDDIYAKLRFFL